jgi:uncharacterized protein HemX
VGEETMTGLFLKSLTGQLAVVAVLISGAVGWLYAHDKKVAKKTEENIVRASEKKGAVNAAKSKKAHDAARAPGAAERLRKDPATCIDCSR